MAQEAQSSIHVRLPPALHEQMRAAAAEQKMSLNALIVALLAGGIGWTLDPNKKRAGAAATARPVTASGGNPDAAAAE